MGRMRRVYAGIKYDDKDISLDLQEYLQGISLVDNLCGTLDDVDIRLRNDNLRFLNPEWALKTKRKLEITIITENWENMYEGRKKLNCGVFYIDDRGFSNTSISIKGVSAPIGNIRDQKNSKYWENMTLKGLGEALAKKHNLIYQYIGASIPLIGIDQEKESDLEFLNRIVEDEGMSLKLTFNKIVIFDKDILEKKEAVRIFDLKGDELDRSWSFKERTKGIYEACELKYYDANAGIEESVLVDRNGKEIDSEKYKEEKILKVNSRGFGMNLLSYAKKRLKAVNQGEVEFSFNLIGDISLMCGQTFTLINAGIFNGKYMINRVSKTLVPFKNTVESYKIR